MENIRESCSSCRGIEASLGADSCQDAAIVYHFVHIMVWRQLTVDSMGVTTARRLPMTSSHWCAPY